MQESISVCSPDQNSSSRSDLYLPLLPSSSGYPFTLSSLEYFTPGLCFLLGEALRVFSEHFMQAMKFDNDKDYAGKFRSLLFFLSVSVLAFALS